MPLTVEDFRATGEDLFGPSWQTPLADALGVAVRTVQRWAKDGPPDTAWFEIETLCNTRAAALKTRAQNIASRRALTF